MNACWKNQNQGKRAEGEGAVGSSAVQGPSTSPDVGGSGSTSAMYGGLGSSFGPVQGSSATDLFQSILTLLVGSCPGVPQLATNF